MKFKVTFKDPDVVSDAITEAIKRELVQLPLSPEEIEAVVELREHEINNFTDTWVEYGEYITVEFDTEAGTCTVVPRK